ncbi:MAG: hypothetical protein JNJ61_29050 [Anaerolineae bacterium]|nr:hypothetical protein [Anaerolineae bacterium]
MDGFFWELTIGKPVFYQTAPIIGRGMFRAAVRIIASPHNKEDLVRRLAVSMIKKAAEWDEAAQGDFPFSTQSSSFSEEDLISDFIGFYIGYKRKEIGGSSATYREEVKRRCGEFTVAASARIYDLYYPNGVPKDWHEWRPNLVPMSECELGLNLINEPYPAARECFSNPRRFLSEIASLLNVNPIPPIPVTGLWWPYSQIPLRGYHSIVRVRDRVVLNYATWPDLSYS